MRRYLLYVHLYRTNLPPVKWAGWLSYDHGLEIDCDLPLDVRAAVIAGLTHDGTWGGTVLPTGYCTYTRRMI